MTESTSRRFRPRLTRLEDRRALAFSTIGPEFQVNSSATGWSIPRMASDADRDYVVAWHAYDQAGSFDVFARRYSANGTPQGSEFRVNTVTAGSQAHPTVAMDANADFVIAWTDGNDCYAQRYSATGATLGGNFRVNTYTNDIQQHLRTAMDAAGNFVVVWDSVGQDGSDRGVYARRYGANGTPLSGEFRVNTITADEQYLPSIAMDAAGNFVIAWTSGNVIAKDVFARLYSPTGVPLGSDFLVNSNAYKPDIAIDAAGNFAITWMEYDSSNLGIFAQQYSAIGSPIGSEFQVNTYTANHQSSPVIAMSPGGDFVVAWYSGGQDGSDYGIFAQRFGAAGTPRGAEFQVNTYTTGRQVFPAVANNADGDFVVAWSSYGGDGSHTGVYSQRYHANRPPTTSGLPNTTIPLAPPTNINLSTGFTDADDGLAGLTFSVAGNSNPTLFTSTTVVGSTLTLSPAGANGSATLTVRATDPDGDFIETSFTVTVGSIAPTITGTQVNGGAQQRSLVATLSVTFSAQVSFAGPIANAFTLTRCGGGAVSFAATANTVGGVTVVTLNNFTGPETQSGSLRDGRYTLTSLASQISAGGQAMVANYTFGDAQGLFRFYGDLNGDRRVDISDFGFFSLAYLTPANYNPALDFNNDGRIDIADFGQFSVRFFTTLP